MAKPTKEEIKEVVHKSRKEYMGRVSSDLPEIVKGLGRARTAFEKKDYAKAHDAIISTQVIAQGLVGGFPIAHYTNPKGTANPGGKVDIKAVRAEIGKMFKQVKGKEARGREMKKIWAKARKRGA